MTPTEPESTELLTSDLDHTLDPPDDAKEFSPADADVIKRFLALEAHLADLLDKENDSE